MTAKNPRPLTQPRKGEPNYNKFCAQPGSLPVTDAPMQPSLKEQMRQSDPDPIPPFDHKACILCDHVIVQQVLGNKCKLSGALCCYMRSCPLEDRKKREAVKKAGDRPRPPCEECIYQSQSAEHDANIGAQATKAEREDLLKDLQKFIENADSRKGCEFGTISVAALVRWMYSKGYDCD